MKLSIVVITMNRADQLKEALKSCVSCSLPKQTEFVIVDNASTDNTKDIVRDFFKTHTFPYTYEFQSYNLGVGGGRNRAFDLAKGEYAYFLDDDAVIKPEDYNTFFIKPIEVFEKFTDIATITTNIIDEAWGKDRKPILARTWVRGSYKCCYMFFGGSHFLRCDVFRNKLALYPNIMYGFEELTASLYAMDKGYVHIFMPEISMIHCPKFNKWKKKELLLKMNKGVCCTQYVMKSRLYPAITLPLLWFAFKKRWKMYVGSSDYDEEMSSVKAIDVYEKKINITTLFKLIFQFGLSAF